MGRIKLRSDVRQRVDTPKIKLDDDLDLQVVPDQLPHLTLKRRDVVGRDDDGKRVFDWVTVGTFDTVSMEARQVVVNDVNRLRVEVVILYDGPLLEVENLSFTLDSHHGQEQVYRITDHSQNGFRLTLTGERKL